MQNRLNSNRKDFFINYDFVNPDKNTGLNSNDKILIKTLQISVLPGKTICG